MEDETRETMSGQTQIPVGNEGYESVQLLPADDQTGIDDYAAVDDGLRPGSDLYTNSEFHEVPSDMVDNELYGE